MSETCGTCKYVHQAGKRLGCRRYPPTNQFLIVPKPSIASGGQMMPIEEQRSAFPAVNPDWSCGEYAPKVVS